MKKEYQVLFLNMSIFYCAVFLVSLTVSARAQSSSATFNIDGSFEGANGVFVLQTTQLLNLEELYGLQSADPTGILMSAAAEYGPGAKVEVLVYDYDEENKKKGALIYGAMGTKTGWNEDNWDITGSIFDSPGWEKPYFSPFVVNSFDIFKSKAGAKTTHIKVLSQHEKVGAVCVEPVVSNISSYIKMAFIVWLLGERFNTPPFHVAYPPQVAIELALFGSAYMITNLWGHIVAWEKQFYESELQSWAKEYQHTSGAWCEIASPTPVVLMEVAVKNAKLSGIKIPGLPYLTADIFFYRSLVYDRHVNFPHVVVTNADQHILPHGFQIIESAYASDVYIKDFSKYESIMLPDPDSKEEMEIRDIIGEDHRVHLVGTRERFIALQNEITNKADGSGEKLFSLRPVSFNFMKVKKDPQSVDLLTYELWSLTVNEKFDKGLSIKVTPEGPFVANNGLNPSLATDNEIPHEHESKRNMLTETAFTDQGLVEESRGLESIVVHPNPTKKTINIQFNLRQGSPVKLILYDILGNPVYDEEMVLKAGLQVRVIDGEKIMVPGMHILCITTPVETKIAKVLVE
ncbi:MAG: T9SS type A sorting domain-containing protein [Bacteroidota bacterium]